MRGLNIKTFNKLDLANKNSFCQAKRFEQGKFYFLRLNLHEQRGSTTNNIRLQARAQKMGTNQKKKFYTFFIHVTNRPACKFFFFLTALLYCAVKPSVGRSKEKKNKETKIGD